MTYEKFLEQKRIIDPPSGLSDIPELHQSLFSFQRDVIGWALRRGRAAIFADCGLGKSFQELQWADVIAKETGRPVLILAPLGVVNQTAGREAAQWGYECNAIESAPDVANGINITNYEKLHKIDTSVFGGIVLDESSILKAYDGKTRTAIIEAFQKTPYRLAATATPAPNDYMELGNHAEFLGVCSRAEMLSMFFVHDSGDTSKWRLKGHAEKDFWQWLCSWAVNIRKPSDLGYEDGDFVLPPLNFVEHVVPSELSTAGLLFTLPTTTLQERRLARKASLGNRIKKTASVALSEDRQSLIWCDLNSEQDGIAKALGDRCVSIQGSTPEDKRAELLNRWLNGEVPHMVSKSSIFGFGLNFQHCNKVIYCGISDSYEDLYQSVRRCWRFGQKNPVDAHIVISDLDGAVLSNIKRKQADADRMAAEMVKHMAEISSTQIKGVQRDLLTYNPTLEMEIPEWLQAA
jgi:superfamily II DNA or RNA helicase